MSDIWTSDRETAPIDALGAIRRRWWIVVLGIVLGILAGLAATTVQTKVYDASTSVLVQDTGAANQGQAANARTSSGINLDTEAQLVRSQVVAGGAQSILKTHTSVADLISAVSVTVPPNTQVLTIGYSAATAKAAQAGAKAFAEAYLANRGNKAKQQVSGQIAGLQSQRSALDKQLADASGQIAALPSTSVQRQQAEASRTILSTQLSTLGGQLSTLASIDVTPGLIISEAVLPTQPTSPNKLLDLGGGLLAGLLLGLIVAFVVERTDRRVHTEADASRRSGLPLLASLPRTRFRARLAARRDADSAHFGRLRNAVAGLLADRDVEDVHRTAERPRTVVVCGGRPDDATGVVVANLAAALARSGYPVTLVCADGASSSLRLLGVPADGPGLTEIIRDRTPVEHVVQPSNEPGLLVMGPGRDEPLPLDHVLESLRIGTGDRDAVLMIEAPFEQAEALSRRADLTLAVVVRRRSTRTLLADLGAGLHRTRSRLVVVSPVKGRVAAATAPSAAEPVPAGSRATAGAGSSSPTP